MSIKQVRNSLFSMASRARAGNTPGRAFITRENPLEQTLSGELHIYIYIVPLRLGGYVCQLFCLEPCLPTCQRMAKYSLSIDNLYQKYTTRRDACQFLGPHQVEQTYIFRILFLHYFFIAH